MNTKELLCVTTIAEYGSISKAAERLYTTQPSLSRTLLKIEDEMGAELFKRTTDGLKPTIAGDLYIKHAYDILKISKDLDIKISNINKNNVGRLTIGIATFLSAFIMPDILKHFSVLYPNAEISFIEGISQEIEAEVARGTVDFAILHIPLLDTQLKLREVLTEPYLLAVPKDDPVNSAKFYKDGKAYLDLTLTTNRNFILTQHTQRVRQISNRILADAGIVNPKVKYQTKSVQAASRLVAEGLGFSLVPFSYCNLFNKEQMPNFYYIEEKYNPFWQLVIAYPEEQLTKLAKEFIDLACEILPEIFARAEINNF